MIDIQDITQDNCLDVAELTSNPNGIATVMEDYVCCNAMSIMESHYFPDLHPKALYHDDQLIGFFMLKSFLDAPKHVEIWRLMLDYRFIGKGLGKASFAAILAYLKMVAFETVEVMVDDSNTIAKSLYTSFGFQFHGKVVKDEYYYALSLLDHK